MSVATPFPEDVRPLYRREYDELVRIGAFGENERLELLEGQLVRMSPIGPLHASIVDRLAEALTLALASRARVRVQQPFAALDDSEPEPDLALVERADYTQEHPRRAFLIVEVADHTLEKDRSKKARIYAESGVPEYWIVNVVERVVEVRTCPEAGEYRLVRVAKAAEEIGPTAFADVRVPVASLFPS